MDDPPSYSSVVLNDCLRGETPVVDNNQRYDNLDLSDGITRENPALDNDLNYGNVDLSDCMRREIPAVDNSQPQLSRYELLKRLIKDSIQESDRKKIIKNILNFSIPILISIGIICAGFVGFKNVAECEGLSIREPLIFTVFGSVLLLLWIISFLMYFVPDLINRPELFNITKISYPASAILILVFLIGCLVFKHERDDDFLTKYECIDRFGLYQYVAYIMGMILSSANAMLIFST